MNADRAPTFCPNAWTISEIEARVAAALGGTSSGTDPLAFALEAVLAHYCAILRAHLNRAPDAHLAAFVSLLRPARVPPLPATVPLSFTAAARVPAGRPAPVVPRLTEVAAPAADGGSASVVFQTTRDVSVLRAQIVRAITVDFGRAVIRETTDIAPGARMAADVSATGEVPLIRAMHVGYRAFADPPCLDRFELSIELDGPVFSAPGAIEWGITTASGFIALAPLSDTTQGLTRSGEVGFGAFTGWPRATLHRIASCWLTARMRPQVAGAALAAAGGTVRQLRLSTRHANASTPPDAALYGRLPLDVTREFFPLGERPRFGDVFHVASKYFAQVGARIELRVVLTNPADADPAVTPIPPVSRDARPCLRWDIHTTAGWIPLTIDDQTEALTVSGTISFTVPADVSPATICNVDGGWIRARLISGSYRMTTSDVDPSGVPAASAPSIASIAISMSIVRAPHNPDHVVLDSGLDETEVSRGADSRPMPFQPFPSADVSGEALFVGIAAERGELVNRKLDIYLGLKTGDAPPVLREMVADAAAPRWQVRGATHWQDCSLEDRTCGLREAGFMTIGIGADVDVWRDAHADPEGKLLWLRLLPGIRQTRDARLPTAVNAACIGLNAVLAVQTARFERELLGSSSGRPAQVFHTARRPLLGEVQVDVLEGVGEGVPTNGGTWTSWHCVDDFDESTPESPHFVVDRLEGVVRFGDGRRGRTPPAGGNNIRASYASGGGARGNCAALTITRLRTTIPYVESVTNIDAASGGQDAQAESCAQRAALAWLRHRDRAVCLSDYADLAVGASPEVARAHAIGGKELNLGAQAATLDAGIVGIAIVPRSAASRPLPSATLLRIVKRALDACRPAGVELILLGPSYQPVSIAAALVIRDDAQPARVIAACEQRLDAFLHPLTGGPSAQGWDFGERPHASDLYRVLEDIDGLVQVSSLQLRFSEALTNASGVQAPAAGHSLICAGRHRLRAE